MRSKLPFILPPIILVIGVVTAIVMIRSREPAPRRETEAKPPLVRVTEVAAVDHLYKIESQGTVIPRTEIPLAAEVSGRVLDVSDSFDSGKFFKKGDVLVTLESLDYEAAVERARVALRQAERRLAEEQALADVARREWERVGTGEPTPLTLREPQLAEAEAAVTSARKALEQAERDLARTRVRAPFDGLVKTQLVDAGQLVTRGTPLATIYAVDHAEVRLPLAARDLAYVNLRLTGGGPEPEVVLRADFAGRQEVWNARIVRAEGEIDPRTRLLYAVARVDDPYGLREGGKGSPLPAGLFVHAEIHGRTAENVVLLPRSALRGRNEVLVVDDEDRVHHREVEVLRTEEENVVIGSGLREGERVCLTVLDVVVDGMQVRTSAGDGTGDATPADSSAADRGDSPS